ncbi:MAG: HD domain-containing phosphohydrolase [Gemmatimonadota bacterium]|nr:HD domain-containing phosphohydrolase [Gemmatimonadota bacterium]
MTPDASPSDDLRTALDETREDLARTRAELDRAHTELRELHRIGAALMSERNPSRLMDSILSQARALTTSDAGSLYLVEEDEEGNSLLHFLGSQNDTLPDLPPVDFTLPIDEGSIAGYAATTGEPLVLDDVYDLPDDLPFSFNKTVYDEKYGYRAKSMLVVPMLDHRDHVVGVLQLINRKREPTATVRSEAEAERWVLPYTEREVTLVSSLAGQAAVSIENGRLYRDIENLFAGFIKAAVTAIDRRDPTTAGHSVRVTELTCAMAELMNEQDEGPFSDVAFDEEELKQLRYAGLLHDFGKVAVREETLVKANKLPPVLQSRVEARFALIRRTLERVAADDRAAVLARAAEAGDRRTPTARDHTAAELATIDERLERELAELDRYWTAIREANVPRVLEEGAAEILEEIAGKTFEDADGEEHPYLTPEELHYLSIRRGNLDERERAQIESHVLHSYDFLLDIPWTEDLSRIAEIVRGHHEKLDGTGYPDGVTAEHLALETRIMTVCDIFDALTASDRPYKKAVPVEKALDILRAEAAEGALAPDIVELFIESGVYRKVLETDWREL